MSIYVGNTKINPLGISKVYVGSTKVYEAVSYDPVFANNTWAQIKQACQSGNIPSTWAIGDTKTFSYVSNNITYNVTVRLVDKTEGRYVYASDDSYTHATFFIEKQWYNPSLTYTQAGSLYKNSELHTNYANGIYNNFVNHSSSDLYGLIDEVKVKCTTSANTFTNTEDVTCRLFDLSITETYGTATTENETVSYKTGEVLGKMPYFVDNTSRTYTYNGNNNRWFTRSPNYSISNAGASSKRTGTSNIQGGTMVAFSW